MQGGSDGKDFACNVGNPGSIPGLERFPGGGHGNPLQYSCLENPMDRGTWQAIQSLGSQRVRYDCACTPLLESVNTDLQFNARDDSCHILLGSKSQKRSSPWCKYHALQDGGQ